MSKEREMTIPVKLKGLTIEEFKKIVFTIHSGTTQVDYDGSEIIEELNSMNVFHEVDTRFLDKADLSIVRQFKPEKIVAIVWNYKKHKYDKFTFQDVIDNFDIKPKSQPESKEQVNHPDHYNTGKKEVIEVLKDMLTPEEFIGGLKFNIFKYLMRYHAKAGKVDLDKAAWYQDYLKNHQYPK